MQSSKIKFISGVERTKCKEIFSFIQQQAVICVSKRKAMFEYLVQNDAEISRDFSLLPVEIAGDDALLEQYGVRIPVLCENDREIGWPFELEELKEWLLCK